MKYVASCSFGKDSTALVLRLIEEHFPLDEVVFYDTGMEFDSVYKVKDLIVPEIYSYGAKFVHLKPDNPFWEDMLIRKIKARNGEIKYGRKWCGGVCRWETREKINTIDKQYRGQDCTFYIGIASDETERLERLPSNKVAPLSDWGMSEADCLQYCYDRGITWNEDGVELYSILDRVSCWCCRNKNLKELKAIYDFLPRYWNRLEGLQSIIDEPFKGSGKSIFDLAKRFEQENQQLSIFGVEKR